MNAPVEKLSGMEMMIRSLVKMAGINPADLLQPLAEIRDKVVGFDARLAAMERDIAAIKAYLNIEETNGKEIHR